jgi:hypothetical protein
MKLIDKSALVAEIERRIKINKECMLGLRNLDYYQGKVDALNDTISFLDTLEVKEVDLEAELHKFIIEYGPVADLKKCAKRFFELGVNASNPLTWEDVRLLDLLCCKVDMNCDLEEKEHYKEVLRRFKAQKGV